jgi:uncharacterized protein YdhG (YjbR/CyaY superfamily)
LYCCEPQFKCGGIFEKEGAMGKVRRKKRKPGRSASKGVRAAGTGGSVAGRGKRASAIGKDGPKRVAEYIAAAPKPARSRLKEMRAAIRSAVPTEAVEVISYRIPAFKTKKVLVWYAGFSKHCSLFPTASVIEEFRDELAEFTVSKGTVQFPIEQALPTALIKKMVKARVAQA